MYHDYYHTEPVAPCLTTELGLPAVDYLIRRVSGLEGRREGPARTAAHIGPCLSQRIRRWPLVGLGLGSGAAASYTRPAALGVSIPCAL